MRNFRPRPLPVWSLGPESLNFGPTWRRQLAPFSLIFQTSFDIAKGYSSAKFQAPPTSGLAVRGQEISNFGASLCAQLASALAHIGNFHWGSQYVSLYLISDPTSFCFCRNTAATLQTATCDAQFRDATRHAIYLLLLWLLLENYLFTYLHTY